MSRLRVWIVGALLGLSLVVGTSGCAQLRVGKPFDPGAADAIQPLLSAREDVRAQLGPPLRTQRVGDVTVEVHQSLTPDRFQCVLVSYRGDTVVKVTRVE